jgi:hypothetical protein
VKVGRGLSHNRGWTLTNHAGTDAFVVPETLAVDGEKAGYRGEQEQGNSADECRAVVLPRR